MRIYAVLSDREEWLDQQGYPHDYKMTRRERKVFYKWTRDKFQRTPIEQGLIAQARREGKSDYEISRSSRARWNLEMQRRAGTTQFWQLLSFWGDFTPEFLAQALEPQQSPGDDQLNTETEAELAIRGSRAKADLRHGNMLKRRELWDKNLWYKLSWWERDLLKEAKDGTLKRKCNSAVRDLGRGRLRGDDSDDYLDIGKNEGVVNLILDGKRRRVDTSRFEYAN